MTEEILSGGAPEEVACPEEEQVNEVEEKARRMGWIPEDQYGGNKEKWVDAETFIKNGEEILPVLRERLREQDRKIDQLLKTNKEAAEFFSKSEERAYKRAKSELQAKKDEAIEIGDKEAVYAAEKELHQLDSERPNPVDSTPPEITEWIEKNDWYTKDKTLNKYADSMGFFIRETNPDMNIQKFLKTLEEEVKKKFPEKFENPRKNSPPAVSGVTSVKKSNSRSYDNLPADAKAQCDRFFKTGVIKGKDISEARKKYVEAYDWE